MKRFSIALLLIVFSSVMAFAQGTTTGSLKGTVSGPDGVLPGATVTATDNNTRREQTVTSSGDGSYSFTQLEFGTYTIRVTAAGFKTLVANEQKIDVGREATLNLTLEVGEVSAEVVVTAGADVVTATTAQVSNTVSPQQILSLPLLTRNPLALTALQAGVSSNSAQNTTINGMRTTFTNITRDGINIQDPFIRTNATDFAPGRPSVDDTGEFTITTTNQEADQGYGGAQIRLVTPRGGADFHGALFAYNRNSEFAANSFFNNRNGTEKGFRNRNQFGGKASWRLPVPGFGEGTPAIFWDKAFWFVSYEGIRDPVSATATRTILSPEARAGAFQYRRTAAGAAINTNVNGATVTCPAWSGTGTAPVCNISSILRFAQATFPNVTNPIRSTISPTIQGLVLDQMPTQSNFTGGDSLNTLGYRFLRGSDQTRDQLATRIDVDFDDSSSLRGIFHWNEELNLRPDVDTSGFTVMPDVVQSSINKQFTLGFRKVITSTLINDISGGFFGSEVPFDRTSPIGDFLIGVPLVTSPMTFVDQGRNTKVFNVQDNADWVLGDHTLRFGGQAQIFRVNAYNEAQIYPTLTIAQGSQSTFTTGNFSAFGGISTAQVGTANGLLALLGGHYTNVVQFFNVASPEEGFVPLLTEFRPFRYENHALYVADRWQAARGLTLNIGVRYEIYPALRNNTGVALEPVIAEGQDLIEAVMNPNGTYAPIGGNAGRRNAYYKTDWDNFAPNLGVAWVPSFGGGLGRFLTGENKTVVRAGYSWVYGNDSIVTSINNAAVGNFGFGRSGLQFAGLNSRIDDGNIPVISPPALPTFPRTYLQNNGQGIGNYFGTVFAVDPEIQTPRVEQYSFGVQREIFGDMAVEVRYVGSRSDNLGRGIDLNQIDIFNNGFLADFQRAQNNVAISGSPFCAVAGCVPLQIFQNGGTGAPGRIPIGGTRGLPLSTFLGHINNGTPADLATSIINSTNPQNVNNQPCIGGTFCSASNVPFVNFLANNSTGVVDVFGNYGRYRYDSLQAEIRKRFSAGLYFQVNYTYSKNLTDAIGTSQALFEPFLDNDNPHWDWQRADFDTTHVFNFNGVYQLPFGQGKRFFNYGGVANMILGGWELSGLGQWQSGAPITFVDTRGTFNRSGRSARQTPFSTLSHDEIQSQIGIFEQDGKIYWINPALIGPNGAASNGYGSAPFEGQVFFNVEPGQTGNIGRAIIDGPAYFNVNLALLKNIRFTETMRLQLRMEAFNVLNNVNLVQNTQFANINSTTFGQITGAFGPRELQFAARFEW